MRPVPESGHEAHTRPVCLRGEAQNRGNCAAARNVLRANSEHPRTRQERTTSDLVDDPVGASVGRLTGRESARLGIETSGTTEIYVDENGVDLSVRRGCCHVGDVRLSASCSVRT